MFKNKAIKAAEEAKKRHKHVLRGRRQRAALRKHQQKIMQLAALEKGE